MNHKLKAARAAWDLKSVLLTVFCVAACIVAILYFTPVGKKFRKSFHSERTTLEGETTALVSAVEPVN